MSSANSKDTDTTRPCNYCKRDVVLANVMLHEVHCMRHIALCPQCNEPVPKTQVEEHIAQEHSKLPCEWCEKEVERNELEDHKVNKCEQRPVTCQYCEIELPLSKMREHEDACGSRTEKCMTCQSYIMIKCTEEHKLSNCKPPEEEQYWEPEEQDLEPEEDSPTFDYANEYDDYDDLLPCEFCGRPYPFDFLIQHQSGCDKSAVGRSAFSSVRQPLQFGLKDDDVPEDEIHDAATDLDDQAVNQSDEEPESVKGGNHLTPKDQANGLPVKQNRGADRSPNVRSDTSAVEKNKTDKSISIHENLDAERAKNKTSARKEYDTSIFDAVIPCEFCDAPIPLTHIMDHQKTCRWLRPNMNYPYVQHHFAGHGENEYDFDESPARYQRHFQRGRGNAATIRGRFTNGNTKWTSERNTNGPDRPHSGQFGFRNYRHDMRESSEEDQSGRYKGRTGYSSSKWQHEEQDRVRPLAKFDEDNQRQKGQREEQETVRQQREDSQWSKRQQEEPDKPNLRRHERTENPRSRAPLEEPDIHRSKEGQEQASMRPEGQKDTQEQKSDQKYRPQPRGQQVGVGQQLTREAQGKDKEVSQSAREQPEEQNWKRNRLMEGQGQTRVPSGRGRPTHNHSNTGSEREKQENRTSGEPATVRTDRRLEQKPAQNHNFRDVEGQDVRLREDDDQGHMRSGRGRGRGRHYWGQERWDRTNDYAQEEDHYYKAQPRRSYRDHNEDGSVGQAGKRPAMMNRGQKQDYAREDLEYNRRRPPRANRGRQE